MRRSIRPSQSVEEIIKTTRAVCSHEFRKGNGVAQKRKENPDGSFIAGKTIDFLVNQVEAIVHRLGTSEVISNLYNTL